MASAADNDKSKREIVSTDKHDNHDIKEKIDKIKTEEDILKLSDDVKIKKIKKDDNVTQYIICEDASSTRKYSDGSIEQDFEVTSFLIDQDTSTSEVVNTSNKLSFNSSLFRSDMPNSSFTKLATGTYGYDQHSTQGGNDVVIKAIADYTILTCTGPDWEATCFKITGASGVLIDPGNYLHRYLRIKAYQSGNYYSATTYDVQGLAAEGWLNAGKDYPTVGVTYSIPSSSMSSTFTKFFEAQYSYGTVQVDIDWSRAGGNWYNTQVEIDIPSLIN